MNKITELRDKNIRLRYYPKDDGIVIWFFRRSNEDHLAKMLKAFKVLVEMTVARKNKVGIQPLFLSIIGAKLLFNILIRFFLNLWGAKAVINYVATVVNDEIRKKQNSN
jgi:hypothetical protein